MNSITEIFQQGFCKIALFKVSEYFLRNISVIPFLRKCKTPLPIGDNFIENRLFGIYSIYKDYTLKEI